jgi:hypothetical protein
VATYPGQAALTRMPVPASSRTYWSITALRNVFEVE